jgi:hypothetical protein
MNNTTYTAARNMRERRDNCTHTNVTYIEDSHANGYGWLFCDDCAFEHGYTSELEAKELFTADRGYSLQLNGMRRKVA